MRIPNKSLLYTIFSSRDMLVSLVDVTESMWPITDKNIERLHELIVRSTSTYFGHDEYLSTCDKVANLLYVIAKNHDFENGNKRTAIVVVHMTLMVNNLLLVMNADDLYDMVIMVVQSASKDKDRIVNYISREISKHIEDMGKPFSNKILEKISETV